MKDNSEIRVLVVDDEESIRKSLVGFLEDFDFKVCSAGSAEEGLEIVTDTPLDAAVVDLRLPGISGDAMILKAYNINPKMRFIIHTGSVTYKLPGELIRIGMRQEHVFLKPLPDLTVLVDTIESLLYEEVGSNGQ